MAEDFATRQDLRELEARLLSAAAETEARTKEFSRDLQTEILKAIYQIAEATNKRLASLERSDIGFTERFAALENRILSIEKRLNLPPGAAA